MNHTDSALTNAIRILEEFRKLDQEMQMQTALIFLLIARDEGCNGRALMQFTGLSSAAVSRNMASLSKVHRKGKPGHDVVVSKEDIRDRRNRKLFLTVKGRSILSTIEEGFGDAY